MNTPVKKLPTENLKAVARLTHPAVKTNLVWFRVCQVFEVTQSVAPTLDVDDVGLVQQPVEDGGGERFVASHQLGPVADGLVGGDERGATAVTIGDQPEEQAGFLASHGLEPELVDDQKRFGEVLAPAQSVRRQVYIVLQGDLQFVEPVELDGEPALNCLDAEGDGKMRLAQAGRLLDEDSLGSPDIRAGCQGIDARTLDGWLEREVEVGECLSGGQAREAQGSAYPACLARAALGIEQLVEEHMGRSALLYRAGQLFGQAVCSMGEPQLNEPFAGVVDIELAAAHLATSSSAA